MLSPETLEAYRRMTTSERLKLTIEMTQASVPFLLSGDPEKVARICELLRRENDARNKNMLEALARTSEAPMNDVLQVLMTIVRTFNQMRLPDMVMGGMAVRAHAIPRPTQDVDFTAALNRDQLPLFFQLVMEAGFTVPESDQTGWDDQVADMPLVKLRMLLGPHAIDADISLAESDFQQRAVARREQCEVDEVSCDIVSPEDLILFKLIANRPREFVRNGIVHPCAPCRCGSDNCLIRWRKSCAKNSDGLIVLRISSRRPRPSFDFGRPTAVIRRSSSWTSPKRCDPTSRVA